MSLSPFQIVVASVSAGGAYQATLVSVPAGTRTVTLYTAVADVHLGDNLDAAGVVVTDAHRFPVLPDGLNELDLSGFGPGGAVVRLCAGTPATEVRLLCQR